MHDEDISILSTYQSASALGRKNFLSGMDPNQLPPCSQYVFSLYQLIPCLQNPFNAYENGGPRWYSG